MARRDMPNKAPPKMHANTIELIAKLLMGLFSIGAMLGPPRV